MMDGAHKKAGGFVPYKKGMNYADKKGKDYEEKKVHYGGDRVEGGLSA